MTRFARYAWGLLAYDVAVVAWGGYVRATGAGAGCGNHWPLCNGEVVPRAPRIETLVELSHRVSSGVALVLTLGLLAWALREYPRRHPVRRWAGAATGFMIAEALIGAALVLFALVAHNASAARALSVMVHLINTFFLLGSTALAAWWASGWGGPATREPPIRSSGPPLHGGAPNARGILWTATLPLVATLVVASTGAVTALGDTLFPAASVAAGLGEDFAPGAHPLVHLRALHPVLAVATAAGIVIASGFLRAFRPTRTVRVLSRAAAALAVSQVLLGLLDVLTLAPVWIQLAHLVVADTVWIALVLTAASALADGPGRETAREAAGETPARG